MYDKLDKCPLCNSKRIKNSIICTDYFLSGESFAISQCEDCNLEFTNPRPGEDLLSNYYQSSDYISHSNKGNSLINKIYKLVRRYTINKKVKLINSADVIRADFEDDSVIVDYKTSYNNVKNVLDDETDLFIAPGFVASDGKK